MVDKDLVASSLATSLNDQLLIFLTDVDRAYLNFGSDHPTPLENVNLGEMQTYLEQGHFHHGSMGPKVEAALQFIRDGGKKAIITAPECLDKALLSKAGTQITSG